MRNLVKGLFARGLNGPLRILTIEGAVLQLLAAQSAAVAPRPRSVLRPPRAFSPSERTAIDEARERLLADMRSPPTLGALATVVNLTEKRLNAGFRALFGATAFEVLRNERLEHARLAIEAGASLKEVALRVGYVHANNFIRAFTARYGTPPLRYRSHRAASTRTGGRQAKTGG
ncbi:MAG: helix-turn-helix transcriptional regulator [Stellaceae bacterium]